MIDSFRGSYFFLSNFFPCIVQDLHGRAFASAESAYQFCKFTGPDDGHQAAGRRRVDVREQILLSPAKEAKRLARLCAALVRTDWNDIRVDVMRKVLRAKFLHGFELAERLLATGDEELSEGNWWGDQFWGKCEGEGENWLGRLLMERRAKLFTLVMK
jgi:ribA/ribD-fused uncharacterized protein